jgi:hypothetical protein
MGDEADGSDGEGERALTVAESVGVPDGGLHANLHGHGVGGEFVRIFFFVYLSFRERGGFLIA